MSLSILSNRYKVLNVLGDGGFGQTFLVEDTQMPSNRRCVLKQLKPIHTETPELRQLVQDRFQREAATLEMLGEAHDQIPRLYAYFLEAERFYLVQEWIDGLTIAQKVQQEGIQSEQAVKAMISQLLGAIAFIHSKGIVHRDIKPANIILRRHDNNPVLIDFGAVKETMNTIINSQEYSTRSIVVGTPGYMPVEQLSGRPVYSSDIYSLGMTAIYMLTGKIPQEIASDLASGQFLWREHAPHVSPGFANFLDTAIHTSTQSRFPTVQKMQAALDLLATEIVPTQDSLSPKPHAQSPQQPQTPTIISASPVPSTKNTVVASPVYRQNDSQNLVRENHQPSPSSKNAFILGSLVGLGILAGSVVVVKSLPKAVTETLSSNAVPAPTSPSTPTSPSIPTSSSTSIPPSTSTSTSPSTPVLAPALPPAPSPAVETTTPSLSWEFMGTASSGESVSVNANSIRPSGDSIDFEYRIGDELIVANADCSGNRWYAEKYGWYSPQSEATQSMLNFVCQ